tara:strand:+ start:810 stop:1091 length:282 start_codon:yes stop_codon:yes gene_type:complete
MKKTFNNCTEFARELSFEFQNTQNERLRNFITLVNTLGEGCGCTRRQRAQVADMEYNSIGTILSDDNVALIKAKYQGHTIEFANNGAVFFVIE